MTVPALPLRIAHDGDDVTKNFQYNWRILDKNFLLVTQVEEATGIETELEVDTDYAVTGVGNETGGYVVFPTAPSSMYRFVFTPNVPYEQAVGFTNEQSVPPERVEEQADALSVQIKQIVEKLNRAVTLPVGSLDTPINYIQQMNITLAATVDTYNDTVTAKEAMEAEIAAADTLFNTYLDDADASKDAAALSAADAATSLSTVQALIDGAAFQDTVFLTAANSPFSPVVADVRGKMFSIDTSGLAPGVPFVFNLPAIGPMSTTKMVLGIKKATGDTNTISVLPAAGEKIDITQNSYVIQAIGGAAFYPDKDPTPDSWTTASFGASQGDVTPFLVRDGVAFTAGVSTTFNIGITGKLLNLVMDRETLDADDFGYDPNTGIVTLTKPVPYGVKSISGNVVSLLAVGQTGANTVGWLQVATSLIGSVADLFANVANKFPTVQAVVSYIATLTASTKVFATAGQLIGVGGPYSIAFANEVYDDGGWHDNVTSNQNITVNFTGRVSILGHIELTSSGALNFSLYIYKNGIYFSAMYYPINVASSGLGYLIADEVPCAPGDTFELRASTTTGNITIGANSTFTVRRIK